MSPFLLVLALGPLPASVQLLFNHRDVRLVRGVPTRLGGLSISVVRAARAKIIRYAWWGPRTLLAQRRLPGRRQAIRFRLKGDAMELRQLAYFKAAAETLSFTKAAQLCHVTQSTLGQQVRQMEQELGCPLFERTRGGGLVLTEKGSRLLVTARKVLSEVACTVSDITSEKSGHTLKLGYYGNALAPHLGGILGMLRERHPDIVLEICEEGPDDLTGHVLDNTLDCAFTVRDPNRHDPREIACEQVHSCPYVVLVQQGCIAAAPGSEIPVADVPTPIVTLSKIQSMRLASKLGGDASSEALVGVPCNTHRALTLLVASGQCSALAPEDTWIGAAGVEAYHLSDLSLAFHTCLIWRVGCTNPAVNALRNACHAWFAQEN